MKLNKITLICALLLFSAIASSYKIYSTGKTHRARNKVKNAILRSVVAAITGVLSVLGETSIATVTECLPKAL